MATGEQAETAGTRPTMGCLVGKGAEPIGPSKVRVSSQGAPV